MRGVHLTARQIQVLFSIGLTAFVCVSTYFALRYLIGLAER
jgi:hypothetical protein